ncbi:replicative DNA helicase [Candidatus Roizmanbacteria bacterium CG10_big_fil_rev_8_21_14_0_10_45_7]|uniref:Replicative DNA helicase n=1 Tax=Candidatus Roizmanbacteria bacterium CG10_big_fil_rev_8_21_14_0_10_45_7 TaxID=1974854 RepID=A0A2M8KTZ1_9BACT|nr:MAG: replicative DNA helicase [Candidatus Roizmanbacteria bacterium CG10_big_fil_rev_8_21_14_0_10_45_7]
MNEDSRLPPHSIEAEQSVLGSVLIDPSSITLAVEILKAEHFYDPRHQYIFMAMLSLNDENHPIDVVTLESTLRKQKHFPDSGGKEYITTLVQAVPTSANIEHYAWIVRNAAVKRSIISIGSRMVQKAYEDGHEISQLLNECESDLFLIAQAHTKRDFLPIREILTQSYERLEEVVKRGEGMRGIPTGFKTLDNKLAGLNASNLLIVAARPGIGKTTFALNISTYLATHMKKTVGFFSLEMSKEELVDRLLVMDAHIDSWKLRTGRLDKEEMDKLTESMGRLAESNIFIDDTPAISVTEMRSKARKMHLEHKLDLLVVDYLQLATTGRFMESRVQEVSMISQAMKNIARELQIPVIALSQLSRAVEQRGGDKRPQLSDLRDSGSIEQDADIVLFLYRADEDDDMMPEGKKNMKLSIAKHRSGPTGEISLLFHGEKLQFFEVENREPDESQG